MNTTDEAIEYGLTFAGTYEDAPFHDDGWRVVRINGSRKIFLLAYVYSGQQRINIKVNPEWRDFYRDVYPSVIAGYHMNKEHWNTVILDGTVPDEEIKNMIRESYDIVSGRKKIKAHTGEE